MRLPSQQNAVRAVFYLDISSADVDAALALVTQALQEMP